MANLTNKLSDVFIRSAPPGRHADGHGLYLEVTKNLSRYWRMKYRYGGKEKRLAFGVYPEVKVAEARQRRDEARRLLRDGRDPSAVKAEAKTAARREAMAGFELAAQGWLEAKQLEWAPETYRKARYLLDTYLLPKLRRKSIATLTTRDAIAALQDVAIQAPALAVKARQYLHGIVDHAVRQGLRDDGRPLSLQHALPKRTKGHIPAATDLKLIRKLVRAIDEYPSTVVRAALQLAMYTAMRPGVVAAARWEDIDFDLREWHVPGARMKTKHDHIVSLPIQALTALHAMQAYTAGGTYVFPPLARQNTPHLHRDSLSKALREMGFAGQHATHGFRAMMRTIARERLGLDADLLEAQLAHAKKGEVNASYDRTKFDDTRRTAMQRWADYLERIGTAK
ncbi:Phage integrase [Lysobacter dokdonensis DS-58]|uniref:Phage integrase n=1 Tax=Lysobacter dokdonensis DS-58 TaxID=1300345 RepID=A0A0A2WLL9_9GAMM|nr:integrase arm-type DNA-binding domain-containing protein [Lysobacter dokdonensis]KGQ20663.1 Phage integrase [Lysobacter dokdonensis DS-58]